MKLNLGCGTKLLQDYINLDYNTDIKTDGFIDLKECKINYPNDSIEEIVLDNVLEHIDLDLTAFILEAKRVLKPNGMIKIITPNCFYWKKRLKYLTGRFDAGSGYHYDHRWLFKPSYFKQFLEVNGFDCTKVNDLFDLNCNIVARKRP